MFGLRLFFTALARLTASINQSAALFDAANEVLAKQLNVTELPATEPASLLAPVLDHHEKPVAIGNSRRRGNK